MTDLNTLIDPSSGWMLEEATGINDNGWIVGYGYNSATGRYDAVCSVSGEMAQGPR